MGLESSALLSGCGRDRQRVLNLRWTKLRTLCLPAAGRPDLATAKPDKRQGPFFGPAISAQRHRSTRTRRKGVNKTGGDLGEGNWGEEPSRGNSGLRCHNHRCSQPPWCLRTAGAPFFAGDLGSVNRLASCFSTYIT